MSKDETNDKDLAAEVSELRERLNETTETLNAIRNGEIDALVVYSEDGEKVYTLKGVDYTYRLIIEQMSEGAMTMDRNGTILFANKILETFLKVPLEQIIGATIYDFIYPSDRAMLNALINDEGGETRRMELNLETDEGLMPVMASITMLLIDTERVRLLVLTDLTELKEIESDKNRAFNRLQQIFNNTSIGTCVIKFDNSVLLINKRMLEMFGLKEPDVVGKKCITMFHDDTCESQVCAIEAIQSGKSNIELETTCTRKDGKKMTCLISAVPYKDTQGAVIGILANYTDITKLRIIEKSMREAIEIEHQTISNNLHYELGELLSKIKYSLETLRKHVSVHSSGAKAEVTSIVELVEETINQANAIAIGMYPFDIEERGLMDALEKIAITTREILGTECVLNYDKKISIPDITVAINLYYIVLEAVNNSVNFTKAKKVFIDVSTIEDKLEIRIRDEGSLPAVNKKKLMGKELKIIEYRSRIIGADFDFKNDKDGSNTVIISNIGV